MISNSFVVRPLTPVIGAEVDGVDLGALTDQVYEAIHETWLEHLVLFFRDQTIGVSDLVALGERFGPLHIHPQGDKAGHPGVVGIHVDAESKVHDGHDWHSDVSCDETPPTASIMHLNVAPDTGGDTLFANMYAAYDALSEPMKSLLDGLHALHRGERTYRGYYGQQPHQMPDGKYPEAVHPVVCAHPETGRKAIYVNPLFTESIVELSAQESSALLEFLYRHTAQSRFQCRFKWREKSVAIWDNRCTQHMALWDYYPQTRSGHRITIRGGRPV